jgi:hypothetical protein
VAENGRIQRKILYARRLRNGTPFKTEITNSYAPKSFLWMMLKKLQEIGEFPLANKAKNLVYST